jgi:hypothetical protein
MNDRAITGEVDDDAPYPNEQVTAEKSLIELKGDLVTAEAWCEDYTGLEVHLDGAYDPLIVHGMMDEDGRKTTVGSWLTPEETRAFGLALIEAADTVEAKREAHDEEPPEHDKGVLKSLFSRFWGE